MGDRHMLNLVIDFGGTIIKIALIKNINILVQETLPNRSKIKDMDKVVVCVKRMLKQLGKDKNHIKAVGISLPGIVDVKQKTMLSVNDKYQYSIGFDYHDWSLKHFGCSPFLDNDARLALLGEIGYGAAQGEDNAVMLILGTGIGTAAIIEGQILRGKHYQAGILGGHFTIDYRGNQCNCGTRGCAEALASGWSIERYVQQHPLYEASILKNQPIDFYQISQAYKAKDPCAKDIVQYCASIWGSCVVNLIHAYDPQTIILSGGPMQSADIFLPPMQKIIDNAWTYWGRPKIVIAKDPNISVLQGLNFQLNHRC